MSNPIGEHVPDPLSPSGYRWKRHDEPEPTGMLPAVPPRELGEPGRRANETPLPLASSPRIGGTVRYDEFEDHQLSGPEQDDGHVDPDEFPTFDGINSLMIRSIGAPE